MGTQRGVVGDVTWFLEGADEIACAENSPQHGGGMAGICTQIAVAQIGRGEKRRASRQVKDDIAARPSIVAGWPEKQCASRGGRGLREIIDRDLECAEVTAGVSDLSFGYRKIGVSRRRERRRRFNQDGDIKMLLEQVASFDSHLIAAADENDAAALQFDD